VVNSGVYRVDRSSKFRQDPLSAFNREAEGRFKLTLSLAPARRNYVLRRAPPYLGNVITSFQMHDKSFSRRHVTDDRITRYRTAATTVIDYKTLAVLNGNRAALVYINRLIRGVFYR
jgi:hypothetical protein